MRNYVKADVCCPQNAEEVLDIFRPTRGDATYVAHMDSRTCGSHVTHPFIRVTARPLVTCQQVNPDISGRAHRVRLDAAALTAQSHVRAVVVLRQQDHISEVNRNHQDGFPSLP